MQSGTFTHFLTIPLFVLLLLLSPHVRSLLLLERGHSFSATFPTKSQNVLLPVALLTILIR